MKPTDIETLAAKLWKLTGSKTPWRDLGGVSQAPYRREARYVLRWYVKKPKKVHDTCHGKGYIVDFNNDGYIKIPCHCAAGRRWQKSQKKAAANSRKKASKK